MSEFVGKYVCYGNSEGLFCWGRIKSECVVNTMEGPKEAFILDQRMSGPHYGCATIIHQRGDTVLRKDKINLETDVFEKDPRVFDMLTNDDLFALAMDAEVGLEVLKSLGPWNMLQSGKGKSGAENVAAMTLKKRLGMDRDSIPEI